MQNGNEMLTLAQRAWRLSLSSRFSLVTLAVTGVLATGFGPAAFAQDSRPLVIARSMDLNSIDPHRGFCDTCQLYNSSVYETLVTLDAENKIVPLLATKWEIDESQTKFTFHLSTDAKFSDGSPVEAKDVKWSWERLKNLKGNPSFLVDNLSTVETPDAHTVVITLSAPSSELLGIAAAPYAVIVNSDVAAEAGAVADEKAAESDNAEQWFLQHSAGSGPYVLASYEPNAELRLKRNTAYWGKAPAIDEVVIKQVKDAVAQAQMLESGSADIAMQVDPETAKTISSPDVTVSSIPSYNFLYVGLAPRAKSNKVPLTPQVREAISLGIDQQGVVDFTVGEAGRVITAPFPLGFPGADGFEPRPYNPEKAKELLAAAGHPDGITLESVFPNMNIYGVDMSMMMQKIQQDLSKIGVKVNLQPVPFATWREQATGEEGVAMTAVFYAPDFFGTSQYASYFMMTADSPWGKRAGAAVDPSLVNAKEPELYKAALAAKGEEASKLWHELGQELINDHIILPMVSPDLIFAHRSDLKGIRNSACCNMPLAEISR